MNRKLLGILLFATLWSGVSPKIAHAQITVTYTFTANTVANPDEVNTNFSSIASAALNRTGGTITGNISVNNGITIDGIDISAYLGGSGSPTFAAVTVSGAGSFGSISASGAGAFGSLSTSGALSVTGTGTLGGVAITGTGASALDVGGGINAGTGNVGIVGADGRIPMITASYVADVSNLPFLASANTFINQQTFTTSNTAYSLFTGPSGQNFTMYTSTGTGATSWIHYLNTSGDFVFYDGADRLRLSTAGLMTLLGAGTHTVSAGLAGGQEWQVRNTTDGTGAYASVDLGNNASATLGRLRAFAASFTTSNQNVASGITLEGSGVGGLSLAATNASGALRFYSGGTTARLTIASSGTATFAGAVDASASASSAFRGTYTSSDGTAGLTQTCNMTNTSSVVIKNGLITSISGGC